MEKRLRQVCCSGHIPPTSHFATITLKKIKNQPTKNNQRPTTGFAWRDTSKFLSGASLQQQAPIIKMKLKKYYTCADSKTEAIKRAFWLQFCALCASKDMHW